MWTLSNYNQKKMTECRECEGAVIDCMDEEGTIFQCPRCGDKTNQWGEKI